jgi:thiol-disulfide isomerase/thioredoxin
MKKIIILGIACLSIVTACQKNDVATLSGTVQGKVDQPILIADYKINDQSDTLNVVDGKFQKTLLVSTPEMKYFRFGKHRKELFIAPGYKLIMNFNSEKFDSTFRFEGKGAVENSILDSLNKKERYNLQEIYSKPAEVSVKIIDSTLRANKSYFSKLVKAMNPDAVFDEYAGKMLDFEAASLKTVIGLQKRVKDSTFYSYLNSINLEESKYLNIPHYRNLLSYFVSVKTNRILEKFDSVSRNSEEVYRNAKLMVLDKIKDKEVREYLTFSMLHNDLRYSGIQNFENAKAYFDKNVTDSAYIREFEKTYALKLLLVPGKPAPEFTCSDADSNFVSLKDLRGKLVYIDFWATWCGPCQQESPHYIKLQKEYKGVDVTFVSISIDENKGSWLKSLQEEKPECISLIANNGWNSDVAKAYQIQGIPTFVLIDKDGKIITCSAPRPSSPDVRKTLDEHLGVLAMKK